MTNFSEMSLAPDVLTHEAVQSAIFASIDLAFGLGMRLATMPADCGWSQSTFWDHDGADHIADTARSDARGYAKANGKFYNTDRLDGYVGQMLIEAFSSGFLLVCETPPNPESC